MVQMNQNYFGQAAKLNVNSKLTVGALKKQEGPQQVKLGAEISSHEISARINDIKPGDIVRFPDGTEKKIVLIQKSTNDVFDILFDDGSRYPD